MRKLKNYRLSFDFRGIFSADCDYAPQFCLDTASVPRGSSAAEQPDALTGPGHFRNSDPDGGSPCFLINKTFHRPVEQRNLIGICTAVILYLFGWIFYFMGFTGPLVIITLSVSPCLAFLLFAWGRKNGFGVLFSFLFLILHTLRGILNYLV